MKLMAIPSFIPAAYRHEIKCLLGEQHRKAIIEILEKVKLDDDVFLEIANLLPGMRSCPIGVLEMSAAKKGNEITLRVLKIRTGR